MKFAKPMITFATMALSAFAYAFWLGPWFAIGLVGMLFLHELGHVIAVRLKGHDVSAPVFIPFLGAVISAPAFKDREEEAFIGYGGPLLGTLTAALLLVPYFALDPDSQTAHVLLIVSFAAMLLNLFNMIPLSPLDGGRITQAVGGWFQYVGIIALLGVSLLFREPVMLMIWVIVADDLTFLQYRYRHLIKLICAPLMVVLMLAGFSHQPWWVDAVDIVIVALSVGLGFMPSYQRLMESEKAAAKARPLLPRQTRITWASLYLALTAALLILMAWQATLLPHEAMK